MEDEDFVWVEVGGVIRNSKGKYRVLDKGRQELRKRKSLFRLKRN